MIRVCIAEYTGGDKKEDRALSDSPKLFPHRFMSGAGEVKMCVRAFLGLELAVDWSTRLFGNAVSGKNVTVSYMPSRSSHRQQL